MWPFRKKVKPVEEAPPVPIKLGLEPLPIVLNPDIESNLKFAAYRLDAIARDTEQRVAEGRPRHKEHSALCAEARMYAHMLMAANRFTNLDMENLERRLV